MSVKRWYCESRCGWMENVANHEEISDSEEFVAAEDFAALEAKLTAIEGQLTEARKVLAVSVRAERLTAANLQLAAIQRLMDCNHANGLCTACEDKVKGAING